MKEQIVTGKKFRILADVTSRLWHVISFWTKAQDVEFNDGSNAQSKLGNIAGISDSLTSTSSNVAASAKAVKVLNDKIVNQIGNLNGQITNKDNMINDLNGQIVNKNQTISDLNQAVEDLRSSIPPTKLAYGQFNNDVKIMPFKFDFVGMYGLTNDKGAAAFDDWVNNRHIAVTSYNASTDVGRTIDRESHAFVGPVKWHYVSGSNSQENVQIGIAPASEITLPFSPTVVISYYLDNDILAYSVLDLSNNVSYDVLGYNGDTNWSNIVIDGNTVRNIRSGWPYFAARF